MRSILLSGILVLGISSGDVRGASVGPSVTAPPDRPLPLTAGQFAALKTMEREPVHRACRDVPASYASESAQTDADAAFKAAKTEADLTHYGFLTGLPATMLILLIAAAPL